MKNLRLIIPLVVVAILAILVLSASAQSDVPEGVQIFYLEREGLTCLLWPDGSGDCYCPCDPVCPEPVETMVPISSVTPESSPTPRATPSPLPTLVPSGIPKAKCNRGLGNFSENCDPGNSWGRPGAAGEDNEPYGPPRQN